MLADCFVRGLGGRDGLLFEGLANILGFLDGGSEPGMQFARLVISSYSRFHKQFSFLTHLRPKASRAQPQVSRALEEREREFFVSLKSEPGERLVATRPADTERS